jgi:hypothetical protein
MKGQLTRDQNGDLWVYIAPHHTGYWKFVDADANWVDRGMALKVTGDAAALFEAAPDLLEACKQLRDCLSDWMEIADSDDLRDSDSEAIKLSVAAIAKAEGRSE